MLYLNLHSPHLGIISYTVYNHFHLVKNPTQFSPSLSFLKHSSAQFLMLLNESEH